MSNHNQYQLSKVLEIYRKYGCRSQPDYLQDLDLEKISNKIYSDPKFWEALKEFMQDEG